MNKKDYSASRFDHCDQWIDTRTGETWFLTEEHAHYCAIAKKVGASGWIETRIRKRSFIKTFEPKNKTKVKKIFDDSRVRIL